MTAAFDQRESEKQAARLKSLAEQVGQPAVAGANGRKPLKPEHQQTWRECIEVVARDADRASRVTDKHTLAWQWREQCRSAGITFGWILGRILFRLLVELASRWIEANRDQMTSGVAPS
jgi:hypothetical protein